ncbi:sulfatase family protein [Rubritalea sp.]|uniref:sulfatase family protein n=1 Tax=Rubritalea sp. TaxID=2109375 RepID=UPI003EF49326
MKKILSLVFALSSFAGAEEKLPNIVYILADDMGYGDVKALNPENGKIATPAMDKLAKEGMIFTDAHTCSSVCTPTRYGLLTGRYNWRTTKQRGVLNGTSGPLIPTSRTTVAKVLQDAGYTTAMVGKWHLGLGLPKKGKSFDWTGEVTKGPVDLGFDYWYGISASLDFPPYIYIHNNKFVGEATAKKAFHRPGPAEPSFEAVEVLDELAEKSVEYIQSQKDGEKPYFLYVPLTSPHTPIVPSAEWQGKSGLGDYGDFMMQTDAIIGEIIEAVNESGSAENTLVIVSSDNGCSNKADIPDLISKGHYPNAQYRGHKMELWDGGHRVPHIVRWPAVVKAGSSSDEIICLNDFMATCSEITGRNLKDTEGEDSVSFLPALKGEKIETERAGIVHHSFTGKFAYRSGKWKLILAKGSGGLDKGITQEEWAAAPKGQLYDMESDDGETKNLYTEKPEVVEQLLAMLEQEVQQGRSTPGEAQKNDAKKVKIW